jgi:CRP/FNR family transcriptional regulator, cyclic AMP receptor protein
MDRQRLATHAFLAGIPDAELDSVAAAAAERTFAAGDTLMTEGDFGHALFLVEEGSAEVSADGARLASVGPGEVIGEVAVLASGRRTATVVATTEMRVMAFFKRDVWALEQRAPEAGRRLRAAIDERAARA